jgi:collagenase-like PrtC family protease
VKFYKRFSPYRITLPRQLKLKEIENIVLNNSDIGFEVFILNSGCKNIDGFCTFHHGVSEFDYPYIWNFFKKLNLDIKFLERYRNHPILFNFLSKFVSGIDSACLLNYDIKVKGENVENKPASRLKKYFSLYTGIDPCRACEIYDLFNLGIEAVKIIGRNYSTSKKIKDVKFIKSVIEIAISQDKSNFEQVVKNLFKKIYGYECGQICYHR